MKKMKNWAAVLLALTLVFSLAACSGSKKGDSGGSSGEPVTLTMLTHYVGELEKSFKPLIDQWNKENPDIQVKTEGVEFSELLPTIMAKQTSNQGADIIHIYSLWAGQLAKSGVLADAPQDVADDVQSNYAAAASRGASVNGKIYGYPTEVQAFGLYYNKKLLKEAGYENPPATWDELLTMAQAMNKKDGAGKTLTEGFGFIRDWPAIGYHPFLAFMQTAGGSLLSEDQTKVNLNSDAAKKTMELYSKVYGKNGISDIGLQTSKGFGAGQVGMVVNAGWWVSSLKSVMKPEDFANVAAAPVPSPDGKTKGSVTYTWAWAVNKQSKKQEAAWKFLKWFNAQAGEDGLTPQGTFLLKGLNLLSTRNSDVQAKPMQDKLKEDPILQVFQDALQYAQPEPNPAAGAEIQNILFKQLDSVWTDQTTPDKALETAQSEIQSKL